MKEHPMKTHTPPAPIALTPCKSSNISATGYDPSSQTLAVQFKGGGKTYHYAGVPGDLFTQMGKAESVGKFIVEQVVGKFKHTLQTPKDPS
jgi:hypothetical protein